MRIFARKNALSWNKCVIYKNSAVEKKCTHFEKVRFLEGSSALKCTKRTLD